MKKPVLVFLVMISMVLLNSNSTFSNENQIESDPLFPIEFPQLKILGFWKSTTVLGYNFTTDSCGTLPPIIGNVTTYNRIQKNIHLKIVHITDDNGNTLHCSKSVGPLIWISRTRLIYENLRSTKYISDEEHSVLYYPPSDTFPCPSIDISEKITEDEFNEILAICESEEDETQGNALSKQSIPEITKMIQLPE